MQKTVLIPTDYTVESLNTLKKFMAMTPAPVHVLLLYCIRASDSIIELLFGRPEGEVDPMLSRTFNEACGILRSTYASKLLSLQVETFQGFTQNAFQNLLEARNVTEIVFPAGYTFRRQSRNSVDPMPFINRAVLPKTEVFWLAPERDTEKSELAELFFEE